MSTKIITIIFMAGIVIVGLAAYFAFKWPKTNHNQTTANKSKMVKPEEVKQLSSDKKIGNMISENTTSPITYDESNGFTPSNISIKTGTTLTIFNNSKSNLNVNISGNKKETISIEPGKYKSSSAFDTKGEYEVINTQVEKDKSSIEVR